jgi:hypothetical protein
MYMSGGKVLDEIKITLRSNNGDHHNIWIDVADNSLSRKWLAALNHLIEKNYHLEKNYCWLGWTESSRTAEFLCQQINNSINAVNDSGLDYKIIYEPYTIENTIRSDFDVDHDKMNQLHRWFEDLQGWSGSISNYYNQANPATRWHIRQLNLLCHEYESLVLSMRKAKYAPEWRRPSQLMCWLQAPRFTLDNEDYELFGINTISRQPGGVYVGVNKAVGKHHWEVFNDEGRDSRLAELITTSLRGQTEAAGDFDIEWGRYPGDYPWQISKLEEFREWLVANNFDPEDKTLTIGHPQVGQVDLNRSFGTEDYQEIWQKLSSHLDVYKIHTSCAEATYDYNWSDPDYKQKQIEVLQ